MRNWLVNDQRHQLSVRKLKSAMLHITSTDVTEQTAMIETIHWHTLHPRYLDTESIVLDLGANYGEFSRAITERFGCHCVAVEPSPEVFAAIPRTPQISKLQLAIASKSGTMPFHIANSSLASSLWPAAAGPIRTIEVQAISLPDLLSLIGCQRVRPNKDRYRRRRNRRPCRLSRRSP